jgi:hypothetical protein
MVTQPPSTTALIEPATPGWAQRMVLKLVGFFVLAFPVQPVRLWTATFAQLPLAKEWPGALVWVPDKGKVAVSNGTAWVTTDGGAL